MRPLLASWSSAVVAVSVPVALLVCPRLAIAQPQPQTVSPAGSPRAVAQRPRVQNASAGEVALERRAEQRLESAQRLLFDGRYSDAVTAFDIVLDQPDVRGIDTLTSWASHGMALAEALNGHLTHARSLYASVLRLPAASPIAAAADSIEAAVLTEQHGTAAGLLDRFAEGHRSALAQQYVHSFRGLDLALAGKCASAIDEVGRAVDVERPIPQAVRGLCAARAGHHEQALALRDSVLTHPLADPMSWPMIVARGVAMRIK